MIKRFTEIRKSDVEIAGGKGANLGEMTHFGIAVPKGFVVTADAYRCFLSENGLDGFVKEALDKAGDDEDELKACAGKICEKIRAGNIPQEISDKIVRAYRELEAGTLSRVAVRSSATAEDLEDASFAGQQETYLNVQGEEEVLKQIRNCYASLWGNRAVIYRKNHGYDRSEVALAVVVQCMVESEVAGVLFTANPLNGSRDEIKINASYGLGESVVSGRVTADSYICDRKGNILSCNVGSKETQIVYAKDGGTEEITVSDKLRAEKALSWQMTGKLIAEALRVEEYYGMPMDIEWGIRDDQVYILQARAITTLNKTDPEEEAKIKEYTSRVRCKGMMRKNMAFMLEKIPYAYLPMDYELIEIIDDQKSVIFAEAGILMDGHPQVDDDGVTILPPDGKRLTGNVKHLPAMLKEFSDISHCEKKLRKHMPEYKKELLEFSQVDYRKLSLAECGIMMERMRDYLRRLCYFRFKYALFSGVLNQGKLERQLKKVDKSLNNFDLLRDLDNETSMMSRDIEKLAGELEKVPGAAEAVSEGMPIDALEKNYPQTKTFFDDFLNKHGYKSDYNCYCTIARTFREDPERMLRLSKPLIGAAPKEEGESFNTLMERLKAAAGEKKYNVIRPRIDSYRYMHVIREESQMMWEEEFYYMRQLLKRTSELLFGTEDYNTELVYLFSTEMTEVCREGHLNDRFRKKITQRKASRPLAEKVWEAEKLKVFPDTGEVLKGVSGSIGEAVGKVCVIGGPEEFGKFSKGDILVCRLTDPEWTPLFSLASAVVADTGAELSHAAIVAREYGIPAVLGVGHATTKYKDGDMIRVNGTKGIVTKVE